MSQERPDGAIPTSSTEVAAPAGQTLRVYIFARKVLLRNTRLFKQASSLTDAGYDVTLFGILPKGGREVERRDGYTIVRFPLDPIYVSLPRRLRQVGRRIDSSVLRSRTWWLRVLRRSRLAVRRTISGVGQLAELTQLPALWRRLGSLVEAHREKHGDASWQLRVLSPVLVAVAVVDRLVRMTTGAIFTLRRNRRSSRAMRRRSHIGPVLKRLRSIENFWITRIAAVLRRFAWPLKSWEYYKVTYTTLSRLEPPDVIQANDLDTLLVAVLLARRYRVPLIYDAQELYVGLHTLPRWYRRVLTWQERMLIRHADRVTVVNDAIGAVMEKKYGVRIDSVILNCPPLTPQLSGEPMNIRRQLGLDADSKLLLYSGAVTALRGLDYTLAALEYLPGVNLVILGEGPLRERLAARTAERGLQGRVFFADFVPHTDVPSYIESADAGIIPYENVGINHYLCSPSKLFHYIMAGLPVVCSDFPFLREIVLGNGVGAVFDPSDPRSIASAVSEVFDGAVNERLRQRAQSIRSRYSWEAQEREFLAIYASMLEPRRSLTVKSTAAGPERIAAR